MSTLHGCTQQRIKYMYWYRLTDRAGDAVRASRDHERSEVRWAAKTYVTYEPSGARTNHNQKQNCNSATE